jgi:Rrf2 family nitric oxide-sensitive transcriptional repressor
MRLKAFTDYSLRVLMEVATAPEGRTTIAAIAAAHQVSEHHLVKVVHLLGREGFLANSRGRGGGLRLSRPAAEIRVGDVVRAMEGDEPLVECFQAEGSRCIFGERCRLAGVLGAAIRAFRQELDRHTLQDLLASH